MLPFLFNDTDSHGCKKLGSTFYSHGEGAREHGVSLDQYIRAGGSPELSLLAKTPRPLNQCEWALDIMTAGWDWLRIGDVTGPNGNFNHARGWAIEAAEPGWRWGRDDRFAWVLQHVRGRKQEGDAEWQAIEKAAAAQPRAPWLDNRSRVVANWGSGRGFCAGGDVREMLGQLESGRPAGFFEGALAVFHEVIMAVRHLPKPVIAAVNGVAAGLGLSYMLYYDMRIASDRARFGTVFSR